MEESNNPWSGVQVVKQVDTLKSSRALAILTGLRYDFLAMTVSEVVRNKVSKAKPGTLFTVDEFEGPRGPIESALSRLKNRGELRRVRKGLYFKGVRSRFGSGLPRVDDVVYRVCGTKGVGPTGWTASRVLGLSTQLPAHQEFAVLGTPPTNIPGARFHSRKNLARIDLNPREIAVLETLRSWPVSSEASWDELVKRVAELRDEGAIKVELLAKVAMREHSPKLREHMTTLVSQLTRSS